MPQHPVRTDPGAEQLSRSHGRGKRPKNVPACDEEQQGGQIAGKIQRFGVGGSATQIIAEQRDIPDCEFSSLASLRSFIRLLTGLSAAQSPSPQVWSVCHTATQASSILGCS